MHDIDYQKILAESEASLKLANENLEIAKKKLEDVKRKAKGLPLPEGSTSEKSQRADPL